MTEDQLERRVEAKIDVIDAAYMAVGNIWTNAEYRAKITEVYEWAEAQRA